MLFGHRQFLVDGQLMEEIRKIQVTIYLCATWVCRTTRSTLFLNAELSKGAK